MTADKDFPYLRGVPPALFLLAWGAYLAGTAPSVYGGDSGELVASALVLGVPHAPGYPLHVLLGRFFSAVIPWGGPAYRVNLLSAFLAAATVAGLYGFLRRHLTGALAALAGAALYAALPIVWDQAQVAEVFTLNNAFAVLLTAVFFEGVSSPDTPSPPHASMRRESFLRLWAFLYGVGLANHQTLLFLAPGFLVLFARRFWKNGVSTGRNVVEAAAECLRRLPAWVFFGGLGLALYLFLFVRAGEHPPVNFGDPHTLRRFWDVLTRKEFGTLELHPAAVPFHTLQTLGEQLRAFFRHNLGQFGGVALLAGLAGLVLAREKSAKGAMDAASSRSGPSENIVMPPYRAASVPPAAGPRDFSWLAFWLFSGPFFFLVSNLSPFNTLAQWRLERFLLLPCLFLAVGAAVALDRLVRRRWLWLTVLLPAGILVEQVTAVPRPFFRGNLAFRDFGRNVAASLAPDSALLIDRVLFDEPTSAVMNHLLVERRRPDVRVIYRPGTLFELFYGEDILEIPREKRFQRQAEREEIFWKSSTRPLAAMAFVKENLPPFPFRLDGLVYRKIAPPAIEAGHGSSSFYLRRDRALPPPRDYPTRLILAHYPYFAAKAAFEAGDAGRAGIFTRASAFAGADMEWLRSNLGSLWSRWGADHPADVTALGAAAREFERAVRIDPYFAQGQFGWGYVLMQRKDYGRAAETFARTTRLKPDWPEAHYMLGLAHTLGGDPAQARDAWRRFIALDPGSSLAYEVARQLGRD